MNFRHFSFVLPAAVLLFLTLLVSCAENKAIPKMSPADDKSCRLALIKVRTELQSLKEAILRYEKSQEKARKAFKTKSSDITLYHVRLRDDARDVQKKADRVSQEVKGLCPAQIMSKQSQKEYKILAADIKRISAATDKIDCTFCKNLKSSSANISLTPAIAGCVAQAGPPDKCKDSDFNACKSCCDNLKPAAELNTSADPKDLESRENCQKECLLTVIDCNLSNCKNTDQCRQKVSPPACDIQACQECCGTNCPSGIDNCGAECNFAAAQCVIRQIVEKAIQTNSTLPNN
jgi:hypothetical protein